MVKYFKIVVEVSEVILLYSELIERYKSDYEIKKMVREGKIFKVDKGVYSDSENINCLEIITKSYTTNL